MENIYYYPESWDMRLVAELELEGGYSFDKHIILQDSRNRFWYVHDAGCSCPVPFEGITEVGHLQEIDAPRYPEFRDYIQNMDKGCLTDKVEFLNKVKEAIYDAHVQQDPGSITTKLPEGSPEGVQQETD